MADDKTVTLEGRDKDGKLGKILGKPCPDKKK